MIKWIEVEAGTVGLHVESGKFISLAETELTKVSEVKGDTVYVLGGKVAFKIDQVKVIK